MFSFLSAAVAPEAGGLGDQVPAWVAGVAVLTIGWLLTRLARLLVRRSVRRVADRSAVRPTRWWRTPSRRVGAAPAQLVEARRAQRIDAAARMISHLCSLAIWLVVAVVLFRLFDLNVVVLLSGAGFVGAAMAIGGQHKVDDYLTGMSVLLEDRYGIGDEIEVDLGRGVPERLVVEHLGLVSTRLVDRRGTIHVGNSRLGMVRNLSQEPSEERLAVSVPGGTDPSDLADTVAGTMRDLAGSPHLTSVLFVDDIHAVPTHDERIELSVRTTRPLSDHERAELVRRTEEQLHGVRG
jgi:small conductance mechanosensitive channel